MFNKEIEEKIWNYIKSSKMAYVTIIENTMHYDEYANHICKKIGLDFPLQDIKDTIINSKKLYHYDLIDKNAIIVTPNDGTNQIRWQTHNSTNINVVEIHKGENK